MNFTSLENLQYFLNKLSYVSKDSGVLNSIITSYLNDFKRDVVKIVSTLPLEGETGCLYLVPQGNNRFIEYYYSSEWIQLGSSVFDVSVDSQLSNASENPVQNKVISNALTSKLNASQLVNALNNTSSETPQSQVIYNLLNGKTSSDDFLKISNSDISSLFLLLPDGSEIFCSDLTTWYLSENGDLYGCGAGAQGQQGSGDTSNVLTFTKRAENVKDFSCSSETSWYVNDNNELYGCGHNNHGQQSSNNTTDILRFTLRRSGVRKVVAENESTWCIKTDDTLYSCGYNLYGWLGKGNNNGGDSKNFDATAVGSNVKDIFINLYTTDIFRII